MYHFFREELFDCNGNSINNIFGPYFRDFFGYREAARKKIVVIVLVFMAIFQSRRVFQSLSPCKVVIENTDLGN
ncbi:hypothetical protein L682_25160 [Aquipseudomonas alcaligenes OT 69]|nr:hypothetical protein L682_25160 [Pseudomonas alcaligenes OT 69]